MFEMFVLFLSHLRLGVVNNTTNKQIRSQGEKKESKLMERVLYKTFITVILSTEMGSPNSTL
jgi:hypothetical protein